MKLVLAGALFLIALNPLMFSVIDPLRRSALDNFTSCARSCHTQLT